MEEKFIILKDNRKLAYAEFGSPKGYPIIYCHGSQSSRIEMHYDPSFAIKNELRIITIDRPGHGISDFNPNGTILSFANDVQQLRDELGINKCAVVGMSAGAPFAMGIALMHSGVSKLGIVSGFAPYTMESKRELTKEVNLLLKLAKSFPSLLKLMLKIQNWQLRKNPSKALANFLKVMSPPDQEVLKSEPVMKVIENMFKEAFRNGTKGVAHEISNILVQNWGFQINEIKTPTYIWHGSEDANVPKAWAEIVEKEIPNSSLKIFPEEGHLIIFKNAEEIFARLKSDG